MEPWERLSWALRRPGLTDQRTVDDLESITVMLSRLERQIDSPRLLLGTVSAHLDTLTTLMRAVPSSAIHRQLCGLAAEAAGLAGWLRWDLGDFAGAGGYFRAGYDAAQEAGDGAMSAYLVGSLACQPFYRESSARRLQVLSSARGATPHTAAWLLTLEAGASALQGRVGDFQSAADRAKEMLLRRDDDRRRPRVAFFDGVYLAEEEAAGYLRLNMPTTARELLQQVLDRGQGRMRLWLALDLAYAAAYEGAPELACHHAMGILADARSAAVEPVLESLRRLPDALPRHHPQVAELVDALSLP
jgi:hypothetical protein